MTHDNPTGLVPADTSSAGNAADGPICRTNVAAPQKEAAWNLVLWLQQEGEWQAARGLTDALVRWKARTDGQG